MSRINSVISYLVYLITNAIAALRIKASGVSLDALEEEAWSVETGYASEEEAANDAHDAEAYEDAVAGIIADYVDSICDPTLSYETYDVLPF